MERQPDNTGVYRVYIDTNCFLHLRDLKDLPWRSLFPGLKTLDVVVSHIVVDELDRQKTDKANRIRDRARAALNLIEKASAEPAMRLQLRNDPVAVWLVVADEDRIDWTRFPRLDPNRPDDQLVAAAKCDEGDVPAVLLSFDTGPLIRARRLNLEAFKTPEDWQLPPQMDKEAQDHAKLLKENAALRATKPTITLIFPDADRDGVIPLLAPSLEPLPGKIVEALSDEAHARWPRKNITADYDDGDRFAFPLGGLSTTRVSEYRSKHDAFHRTLATMFGGLDRIMTNLLLHGQVRFDIANDSGVTAEGLRVEIWRPDRSAIYLDVEDMAEAGGALPRLEPPAAPKGGLPSLTEQLFHFEPKSNDPTIFEWISDPSPTSNRVMSCLEFRPTVVWRGNVFTAPTGERDLVLHFDIGARNLPEPVHAKVIGQVVRRKADWTDPMILSRLPEWMADVIESEL